MTHPQAIKVIAGTQSPFNTQFDIVFSECKLIDDSEASLSVISTFSPSGLFAVIRIFLPRGNFSAGLRDFEATQYRSDTTADQVITESQTIFDRLHEQLVRQYKRQ